MDESFALIDNNKNKKFMVRPGEIVHINYPLLPSGFIEGHTLLKDPQKKQSPLRGIKLKLVDTQTNKTMAQAVSEYDWYYAFDKVPLGRYRVMADIKQLNFLKYNFKNCEEVNLAKQEQQYNCDVLLSNK